MMVKRRLNKLIEQCSLNQFIIDCVKKVLANFLINVVQKETINILIQEINEIYAPKFKKNGKF